ncbi:hypothetical protein CBP31_10640 [Oceanisphaera profunda]|uniref:tRNA-uridine aminocarboxypropyltransferase n=1 Tax=Oceanisphaera profunda TaxID=1416627 RepID=A0A1Y0D641_9GAMM|nr:tRNA-uridine aminocarboxypropyltransferase [Oceanisphaera profunda]ART83022.1 hypothetical protein CBP31_10640 [Oceanisphaera profunda]
MSRTYCCSCQLPQAACLCAYVRPQPCPMPVIIYQHPLEAKHAKSTVPLLRLSVPDIRVEVAETLTPPPTLADGDWWLLYPDAAALDIDTQQHSLLAVKRSASELAADKLSAAKLSTGMQTETMPLTAMQTNNRQIGGLIVLDGTWRKTRLLLHLNPWLKALPTLSFSQAPASAYAIRKGPGGQALSTLESVCHVLHKLHPEFSPAPLLALLQVRVGQFQAHKGSAPQTGAK